MTLWRGFVAVMARRESGLSLGIFRILVGVVLGGDLLAFLLSGAMPALWYPVAEGGIQAPNSAHWVWQHLGVSGASVNGVLIATLLACAALILGVGTNAAAVVALVGSQALFNLVPSAGGGHDRLFTNALFVLALSGAGRSLSLPCRAREGKWTSDRPILAWPRYVLVHQLVLVYTATGLAKIGAEWWPWGGYQALYRSLLVPAWGRGDWWPLAYVYPITQVATAITVPWEASWGIVLLWLVARHTRDRGGGWRRILLRVDLRAVWAAIGVGVHGMLWILLDLGPFSAITIAWYVCLFHPDEIARAWTRLRTVLPGR